MSPRRIFAILGSAALLLGALVSTIPGGTDSGDPFTGGLVAADERDGIASARARHGYARALEAARIRSRAPAATASIRRCGRHVWSGASGVRSLGSRRRVDAGTRFVIASVTKVVTAAMTVQLVDSGDLSLDDTLDRFVPSLPNAPRITVRMLLDHTSGLRDYGESEAIAELIESEPRRRWTRAEVLDAVGPPRFEPGARFDYSNTNYLALGEVIDRAGGPERVEEQFRRWVVPRARMTRSSFAYSPRRSRALFAESYVLGEDGVRRSAWRRGGITSDAWGEVWTDGGLASTAPDVARFIDALFDDRVLAGSPEEMIPAGGEDYGLGLVSKRHRGRRWLGHDGAYGGYSAEAWHDPSRGLTIAVLTSVEEEGDEEASAAERIWEAMARAYRGGGSC